MNAHVKDKLGFRALGAAAVLAGMVAGLPGCRGDREEKPPRQFFPDMDDHLKWTTQARSDFYPDHRTMRPTVRGSVAFSRVALSAETIAAAPSWAMAWLDERADLLKDNARYYQGFELSPKGEPVYLARIPFSFDRGFVALGQEKFNISCTPCHGYAGDGKGMVGVQWATAVANLHDPKYKGPDPSDAASQLWKDGYIFHTIRHGKTNAAGAQLMPGYGHALGEREAWAIVAYVRALQATRDGKVADLNEPAAAAGTGGRQ